MGLNKDGEDRTAIVSLMRWQLGLGNFNGLMKGNDGMPAKDKVATADSWDILPMPGGKGQVSRLHTDIEITPEMMETLRKGHIPEVQEDHWFMYCTDNCVRYYRSWTGDCAFEAFFHEKGNRTVIVRVHINRSLCSFGVNGDASGLALLRYLITAETGGDSERAWLDYIHAWENVARKYQRKERKTLAVDAWFTGTEGKICDGCIYAGGIRRMKDSPPGEIMGCGRCSRETFSTNYMSGVCKFRQTELGVPSEFEIEAKAATLRRIREKFEKDVRDCVLFKTTCIAGTQFIKNKKVLKQMEKYGKLELERECDNPYDENAVAVSWQGVRIGYVPRKENKELAVMLDAGMWYRFVTYLTDIRTENGKCVYEISIYLTVEIRVFD